LALAIARRVFGGAGKELDKEYRTGSGVQRPLDRRVAVTGDRGTEDGIILIIIRSRAGGHTRRPGMVGGRSAAEINAQPGVVEDRVGQDGALIAIGEQPDAVADIENTSL